MPSPAPSRPGVHRTRRSVATGSGPWVRFSNVWPGLLMPGIALKELCRTRCWQHCALLRRSAVVALRFCRISRRLPVGGPISKGTAVAAPAVGENRTRKRMPETTAAIVAENASKLFLDGAVVAFHQLALTVKRNEILC